MEQTKKKRSEALRVIGIIAVLVLFGLMALLNALSDQKTQAAYGQAEQSAYTDQI